jgi:hypothetical protein
MRETVYLSASHILECFERVYPSANSWADKDKTDRYRDPIANMAERVAAINQTTYTEMNSFNTLYLICFLFLHLALMSHAIA